MSGTVWVVVYGDEVHTYQGDRAEERARTLYAVGLAVFGDDDADTYHLGQQRWAVARQQLPKGTTIRQH